MENLDSSGDLIPASGYAVIAGGKIHHLGKVSLPKSRQIAMSLGDEAVISEAVGFSDIDKLVWKKIETIDRTPGGYFLRNDGELMLKLSPQAQLEEMSDAYSKRLKMEYSSWAKQQLDEYFEMLDVDWYDVKDVESVFQNAGAKSITDESDQKALVTAWGGASLYYLNRSASQAREFSKSAFLPKIGSGISTGDQQAMKFLAKQPGFFLRDQLGRVNSSLTAQGTKIVERGIRDGIGYREIGKELRDQLPTLWGKHSANYSNVVANAGVQRSRAFAEISAYVEGGIEFAELLAVLDQRTTDICRFLDGQIIRVDNIVSILNQTLEINNPEEIKQVAPWITTKKDPQTGIPQLLTGNGVVLADITRSGFGKIDDRGEYAARKMGDQLAVDASIGPPPYHGFCRTTMNPVVKTFTAPAGTWRQAIRTAPLNPKTSSNVITPSFFRGLTGAAAVGSISSSNRATTTGRVPTDSRPVKIGDPVDLEFGVWAEDGWIDDITPSVQVKRRIRNSMQRLNDALNEIIRTNGRSDLSSKQKGHLIQQIFNERLRELRAGAVVNMEKAEYNFRSVERERGDMPSTEAAAVRKYALSFLSKRMLRVVSRRKLPRIIRNTSPKGRPTGYWDREENVFYLAKMRNAKSRAVILRVFAKYFDTFAKCGAAAVIARNNSLASDSIIDDNGTLYLDVATPSIFDGLVYGHTGDVIANAATGRVTGSSDTASDWTSSAFEGLAAGIETNIGFLWETSPRQVAFLMAYIEGQFV